METAEFLNDLSFARLGVMGGRGFMLAVKPGEAWLFHENDSAIDVPVDPSRAVAFIRHANWQLTWLPRHSWYAVGKGRTGYLHAMRCRSDVWDRGFDFFDICQ